MNLTLSADPELIAQAREYAKQRGTSLNQLIRDYLEQLVGGLDRAAAADEFLRLALEHPGRSEPGYKFNREEIHDRQASR